MSAKIAIRWRSRDTVVPPLVSALTEPQRLQLSLPQLRYLFVFSTWVAS